MAQAKIVTRARVEGLVILLFGGAYLWQTQQIPSLFQTPGVPGPAAFPTLVGLVFCLGGLWRLARGAGPAEREAEGEDAPAAERAGLLAGLARGWRFYALWVVILAYMFLMPIVGFPLTTVVGLALLFLLLGETRPLVVTGASLVTTVLMFFGFVHGLGVKLPLGVLDSLVK
jgi:putative tricarboxylic transport membrane protein